MSKGVLPGQTGVDDASGWVTLQRVIFPEHSEMDTAPLYVDMGTAAGMPAPSEQEARRQGRRPVRLSSQAREAHAEDFTGRCSTRVRPGERVSFGSYFNAFAAGYWRKWTTLSKIRLSVSTRGEGTIVVFRSNAKGALLQQKSIPVTGDQTSVVDLDLLPFGDGGWYWFDLVAGRGELFLESAEWQAPGPAPERATVTLEITTLNKTSYCLNNLRLLADHPECLEQVTEVLIVDQGTDKLVEAAGFDDVASRLEGKLRIIEQSNLGGSGGFSRGMFEACENGSDYVLLMDDDVVIEPESITRLLTFAAYCRKPTLVGGHMFDLHHRTALHTLGEIVNPHRIQPDQPYGEMELGHDFLTSNLRQTPWMHRRVDVDYNGWWMCLIPTSVIREIGLALPIFIKWDDVEFGLRAKAKGYQTVSLPGAAVWHISWGDKDDLVGWQAYFHNRNRLMVALLYSPFARGGRALVGALFADIKHTLSMQYATSQGRVWAMQDLLKGPRELHGTLSTTLPRIRTMLASHSDTVYKSDPEAFPTAQKEQSLGGSAAVSSRPSLKTMLPWGLKTLRKQLFTDVSDRDRAVPQTRIAHQDNKWWTVSQFDSAIVTNADGTGASWYVRDPRLAKSLLMNAVGSLAQIVRNWDDLAARYKAALPELTSRESWAKTFAEHTISDTREKSSQAVGERA
ncbi:galactofuranosylgalactofuranosylrhamnosyl-N-acetylglucosaminyl-diphospho-decaprenol beta-1,5/1,6-galactofuranosyltransferase [Arthrobacter woluwensis]|uniref:glycosyltransferase n=1 Tax=Arthrobacter woluwensis TaxID=156980 RepID=UPI00277EF0FA|nr:glycosyltransferase [Arthrobacter woluwensis]MDQ0709386.1 galactofuranosylgalactofuranosylrhamnosyl-N-acetylglucosaminyl-diphospho-decaprenol beta-1,5/1,6-galactofuranosyltransferase [Arthrobacter woluwensis]